MTTYRELDEFPGYRFGDDGTVWSRMTNHKGILGQWRRLWGHQRPTGHIYVVLRRQGGGTKLHQIGHWVLLAFVGPCPAGMECLHDDGNAGNNALTNLRWGTHYENMQDMKRHGTTPRGESCGGSKITETLALAARKMSAAGMNNIDIGERVGLDPSVICRIVRGERWQHIGGPVRKRDNRFGATNVYGRVVRVCGCGKRCKGPSYFNHANVCPHAPADPNDAIIDRADFERRLGKFVKPELVA
jgi:hypothetical protein